MITQEVQVTRVFEENLDAVQTTVLNEGGARSSKSYSLIQLMIQKFNNEKKKNLLTCRKTLPALRTTAYRWAVDLMKEYKHSDNVSLYDSYYHNKTMRELSNPRTGSLWHFTSIDSPEKIKSTEYNYIHMEEANEFTYEDYMVLKLRLSGKVKKGEKNHIYLSYNPIDEHGWINQLLKKEKDVQVIHSTYRDAIEFLPEDYVRMLEALKNQDESYWLIYAEGKYAELKGRVHAPLVEIDEFPEGLETIYGLDFAYSAPSALIEVGIDLDRMKLYLREVIHETGLTNPQLIKKMKEKIRPDHMHREIYADSAEPDRIEEISQEGFNVFPSRKSVKDGIDFVNRFQCYTKNKYTNLNTEWNRYKRKVNRKGDILDEPVPYKDHSPNAVRYAAFTHLWERLISKDESFIYHGGMAKEEKKDKSDKSGTSIELATQKSKDQKKEEKKKEDKPIHSEQTESWVVSGGK